MREEALLARLDEKKRKDLKVLSEFVSLYCRQNHPSHEKEGFSFAHPRLREMLGQKEEVRLCADCRRLLSHGIMKRLLCPYDPKPACKKCPTHCYAPGYRERMREVMRFSGGYLIKHGRVDLLLHYLF